MTQTLPGMWLHTAPLLILSVLAWNWGGRGKTLAVMMFLAFALRLAFGLGTVNLLPIYGHPDERREQKGRGLPFCHVPVEVVMVQRIDKKRRGACSDECRFLVFSVF